MIPKAYVNEQTEELLKEKQVTEAVFLQKAIPDFAKDLWERDDPFWWMNYGMYWWNLPVLIEQYAPEEYPRIKTLMKIRDDISFDKETAERYDYGSDLKNWVAASLYLEARSDQYELGSDRAHNDEDENGDEQKYVFGVGWIELDELEE